MRRSSCALTLLAAAACCAADAPWWESASPTALSKALAVRGVECDACSEKELQEKVRQHAGDVIDPELVAMYVEDQRYRRHVHALNMTRSEFIQQLNASTEGGLDEARVARAWRAFEVQLETGSVQFHDNGTIQFGMPFTHRLAPMLPAALCDAIEDTFLSLRAAYLSRVPRKVRRRLETRLEYAAEAGLLYVALAVLILILIADIAFSTFAAPSAAEETTKKKSS